MLDLLYNILTFAPLCGKIVAVPKGETEKMKHFNIIPAPKELELIGGRVKLSSNIVTNEKTKAYADAFFAALLFPAMPSEGEKISLDIKKEIPAEGYEISVTERGAEIFASELRGFVYAASTLCELLDKDGYAPICNIKDSPEAELRGIHTYLPPSDEIDEFCRILDVLAHLKFNTVFLEIGAGVEYESHPEINAAWKRFCRQARDYPGGAQGLQASEIYWKDSTHIELAGGGVLKKEELLKIVDHARALGLEVIPELQALSHSYYLTLAHRDIAEQPFERFPDTYCPMNEKSYELYFDLARELHQLLSFNKVSIGHDEIRVLGRCPRCRQYSGHELLAYEINKLHAFYKELGVDVFMWGEALQNFKLPGGKRMGDPVILEGKCGKKHYRPASYEALDKIPRDITMLDWCYSYAYNSEDEFAERGIKELYGNLSATTFFDFDKRRKKGNVIGAEVSTWCVADENEYGRNGWIFEFAFASEMLWSSTYKNEDHDALMSSASEKMSMIRRIIRGEDIRKASKKSFIVSGEGEEFVISTDLSDPHTKAALENMPKSGRYISTENEKAQFLIGESAEELTLLHGADFGEDSPYKRIFTWYFADLSPRILGHYAIEYEDGLITSIPMEFGVELGNLYGSFDHEVPKGIVKRAEDENVGSQEEELEADNEADVTPTQLIPKDEWLTAAAYFSDAHKVTINGREAVLYALTVKNPRPGERIKSLRLYPEGKGRASIKLFSVSI